MHHICKNIFLTAIIGFMVSCTETTMSEPSVEHQPVAICASQQTITRANDTYVDGSFSAGKRLGVFGYAYDNATWQSTLLPNFFNNQPMTIESTAATSSLSYSPVVFWPVGGKKVAVYGYYPYSEDATNIVPDVVSGMGAFTYSTPLQASEQTDFMVSPLLKDKTYAADGGTPLNLTFYQTLARIEISVDLAESGFSAVTGVKVLNVKTQGTFNPQVLTDNLNTEPASDDWRTTAWTTTSDVQNVTIDDLPASGNLMVTDGRRLLLIPQQCYPALQRIELTLKRPDDTTVTLTYPLSQLWEAGKIYEYKFTNTELTDPTFRGNAGKAEDGGTI